MADINKLSLKIGGEAGYGIIGTGSIFTKMCMRLGLYAFMHHDYPSLIRGGHNVSYVRVEDVPVLSHIENCDLLIALNKETIDLHKNELTQNGGIIYDNDEIKDIGGIRNDIKIYGIPLVRFSREISGTKILINTISLGASVLLLGVDINLLCDILKETYEKKGEKVIDMNIKAAKKGYDYFKENYSVEFRNKLVNKNNKKRIFITGNEAISVAAIKAGLKFHAQYPMTPSSQILHYLINKADDYGIVVLQLEDEISVINSALGASWAGARSMVATSGGGFCLMSESFSLAGMVELPLVIIMGQRGGPATGLPTKTEQGELRFMMHSSHGEFPRIVLAPGDIEECFYLTLDAFNLADQLQNPIIILHDQYLANNAKVVDKFDVSKFKIDRGLISNEGQLDDIKDFKRYKHESDTGVSLRSIPGQKGGLYSCGSDEHDEYGQICEDASNRNKIMERRMNKMNYALKLIGEKAVNFFGEKNADITIVSWGSIKGMIIEAMKYFADDNIKVNFLQIVCASPFPSEKVLNILKNSKMIVAFEQNFSAQMCGVIREHTGIYIKNKWVKYNGIPFSSSEIYQKTKFSYFNYTK